MVIYLPFPLWVPQGLLGWVLENCHECRRAVLGPHPGMCCPLLGWAKICCDGPSRWNAAVVASPVPCTGAMWTVSQSHFFFGNAAGQGEMINSKASCLLQECPCSVTSQVLLSPRQQVLSPAWSWALVSAAPAQLSSDLCGQGGSRRLSLSACFLLFSAVSLRNKVCSCVILIQLKKHLLQAALSLSVVLGLLSRGRRDHNAEGTQKQPEPLFSDRQGEESQSLPSCLMVWIFFSPHLFLFWGSELSCDFSSLDQK